MQVKRIRAQQAAHSQGTRHENSVGRQTAQEQRWKEKIGEADLAAIGRIDPQRTTVELGTVHFTGGRSGISGIFVGHKAEAM